MSNAACSIFTIGYATHSLEEFVALLKKHAVTAVADVRSSPYGRSAEFAREVLKAALPAQGIQYVFLGRELGARREEKECYVDGQATYDRIARLPLFREGLERLRQGAQKHTIALMCAEKDPANCHRSVLICRHLRPMGFAIRHILADGSLEEHEKTEKRLVELTGMEATLFDFGMSGADRIERAYDERSKEIAYRQGQEEESP